MSKKQEKERYERMQLKNGWDLPKGEKPPATGRSMRLARAYELLVLKSDEELAAHKEKKTDSVVHKKQQVVYKANRSTASNELITISNESWRKKKRRRLMIILAGVLLLGLAIGCRILFGPAILTADISKYRDVEIEVEGLKDEPFTVTVGEIAKMKKTSLHMEVHNGELGNDEEPLSGDAIGPTLTTFMAHYGKTPEDFKTMRVYAGNDQSKAYVHTMKEEEIIMSVANGRYALGEKEMPLRLATSTEDPSEWFGWVRKIVFTH